MEIIDNYNLEQVQYVDLDVDSTSFDYLKKVDFLLNRMIESMDPIEFKWICISLFHSLSGYAYIAAYRGAGTLDERKKPYSLSGFSFFNTRKSTMGFIEIIELCRDYTRERIDSENVEKVFCSIFSKVPEYRLS